jgi:hypothetical protein
MAAQWSNQKDDVRLVHYPMPTQLHRMRSIANSLCDFAVLNSIPNLEGITPL